MAAAAPAAPLSDQELDQMLAACIAIRLRLANHQDVSQQVESLLPRVIAAVNQLQRLRIVCP